MPDPVLISNAFLGTRPRLLESYLHRVGKSPTTMEREEFLDMLRETHWVVVDDQLFLTLIGGQQPAGVSELRDAPIGPAGRVHADWVSGILYTPPERVAKLGFELAIWRGRVVFRERPGPIQGTRVIEPGGHLSEIFAPEELGFVRVILANREDRTTRLVYADWLDERNDVRGALLRLDDAMRLVATSGPHAARFAGLRSELIQKVENWVWLRLTGFELSRKRVEQVRL